MSSIIISNRILQSVGAIFLFAWGDWTFATADPTDSWLVNLSESITADDNLFRVSADPRSNQRRQGARQASSRSDLINRLSATGMMNLSASRQSLMVDVNVTDHRYVQNGQLNHLSSDNRLVWKWEAGRRLTGNLGYGFRRYQGGFTNTSFFGSDFISENTVYGDVKYALHPSWRIEGGGLWIDAVHSAQSRNFLDIKTLGATAALVYTSNSGNSLALEYQFAESDLPNRQAVADSLIDNHNIEQRFQFAVNWRPTERLRWDGRIGYTSREFRTFDARDFSGLTWRAALSWDATGKTNFTLGTWRDLLSAQDLTANYLVAEGVSLSPTWRITSKITLSGTFSYENRLSAGDPGLTSSSKRRSDEILGGQIGVRYSPTQALDVGLYYRSESRTSNIRFADYEASIVSASVSLRF